MNVRNPTREAQQAWKKAVPATIRFQMLLLLAPPLPSLGGYAIIFKPLTLLSL